MDNIHWYFIDETNQNTPVGPFFFEAIKTKFHSQVIVPDTYCWHEEIRDWQQLKHVYYRGSPALDLIAQPNQSASESSAWSDRSKELQLSFNPHQLKPPEPQPTSQVPGRSEAKLYANQLRERLQKQFATTQAQSPT